MADLILYKDSPNILEDFGRELSKNLKMNLDSRRIRRRYDSTFETRKSYVANEVKWRRSGFKKYKATGDLSRSITYSMRGLKLYISFNEYGVMLDRGSDGYVLRQTDSNSELYDADINYKDGRSMDRAIRDWVKERGLKPRKFKKGTVGKPLKNTAPNRRRMEYLIKRSILNRGQNATYWFTAPYKAISEKLPNDLIFGMYKTIDDSLDYIFKK